MAKWPFIPIVDELRRVGVDRVSKRFWSKVDRGGPDDCWPWIGRRNPQGYGHFDIADLTLIATRVAWVLLNERDIPETQVVMHSCDNPCCVNPSHLSIGTEAENAIDSFRKGRRDPLRGERQVRSKLTEAEVLEIRASNQSDHQLAAIYGVSHGVIWRIRARRSWRHI